MKAHSIILDVEGHICSYAEFHDANTAPDAIQPTETEFAEVRALAVGESTFIGLSEITRIK